jgi:hypothetical protein
MSILSKNRLNMSIRENVEFDPKDVKSLIVENEYLQQKIEKHEKTHEIDVFIIYGLFAILLIAFYFYNS